MQPENIQQIFKRKYAPVGSFILIDNAWVHYWQSFPKNYHEEQHKTVVFIHGLSGSLHDFLLSPIINLLKVRYRIILLDRPGAGYSYWIDEKVYTLENQATVIKNFLEKLNIENPIIIGHSLGGALALTFNRLYPDYKAKYLLLAPLIYPVPIMFFPLLLLLKIEIIKILVFRIIWLGQKTFFRQLIANAFRPNKDYLQEDYILATEDQINTWYQFKAEFSTLYTVKNTLQTNAKHFDKLSRQVAILHGKQDKILHYQSQSERLFKQCFHIKLLLINKMGHMLNFTSTAEIVENIDSLALIND